MHDTSRYCDRAIYARHQRTAPPRDGLAGPLIIPQGHNQHVTSLTSERRLRWVSSDPAADGSFRSTAVKNDSDLTRGWALTARFLILWASNSTVTG